MQEKENIYAEFESARFAAKSDYETFNNSLYHHEMKLIHTRPQISGFALEALEGPPCRSSVTT
ncbi:MAG: hypothetical protein CM15mP49_04680 [Actinomycetota bacterium]|nr:MAG: hypothetical protein CM15mP49_04680 [Actinomycetota bacterium]